MPLTIRMQNMIGAGNAANTSSMWFTRKESPDANGPIKIR